MSQKLCSVYDCCCTIAAMKMCRCSTRQATLDHCEFWKKGIRFKVSRLLLDKIQTKHFEATNNSYIKGQNKQQNYKTWPWHRADKACPNYSTEGYVAAGLCSNQSKSHSLTVWRLRLVVTEVITRKWHFSLLKHVYWCWTSVETCLKTWRLKEAKGPG